MINPKKVGALRVPKFGGFVNFHKYMFLEVQDETCSLISYLLG